MPETAIDKYRDASPVEGNIRITGQISAVHREPKSRSAQRFGNTAFWYRAARDDTRHYPASHPGIEGISHLQILRNINQQ